MRAYIAINQLYVSSMVFETDGEHIHTSTNKRGLDPKLTDEIVNIFESGITLPSLILINLNKKVLTIEKSVS